GTAPPTEADIEAVFQAAGLRSAASAPAASGGVLDALGDVGIGGLKGGVGWFVELGNLVHQIPGVSGLVDALYGTPGLSRQAFSEAQQAVTPTNTAQSVGKLGADLAMSLLPSRAIT